jgi:hypothetical protein
VGYLYRAVNSSGAIHRFSPFCQAGRGCSKALPVQNVGAAAPSRAACHQHRHSAYPPAIVRLKAEGALDEDCRHRPVPYLNNVLGQDHRAIKRQSMRVSISDRFGGAWRTIAGYEAVHMIRKGQACWSAVYAKVGLLYRFIVGMLEWKSDSVELSHPSPLRFQSYNTTAVTSSHMKYDRLLPLPSGHSIRSDRYTWLLLHD